MKAAILHEKGVVTYEEVNTPVPGPGNVRMQVKSVSICGSDIKRYKTGSNRVHPIILGHECAGIIDNVGENGDEGLLGKHASIIPLVPCFDCIQCQHGYFSACPNYSFIGSRQAGGFADYVELPVRNVLIVPDELSFEYAALIEPSTIARSSLYKGEFSTGQTALVFGVGSIGLLVVQWLRILHAKTIICVDISDKNLKTAQEMGAHVILNPLRDDVPSEVAKHTGWGVDVSIEVAGAPQTLEQTVMVTRPHGKVVLAGNQPLDQSLPLTFIENMIRRELNIVGNHMSFSPPFPGPAWTDSVTALVEGSLDVDKLISHHFSLAETPKVFTEIGNGSLKHRKIMLQPDYAV